MINSHVEYNLVKLASSPYAITESGALEWAMRSRLDAPANAAALAAGDQNFLGDTIPQPSIVNGVAVIPIVGPMINGAGYLDRGYGATAHGDVMEWLDDADNDPNVRAIVLSINSPGGTVSGSEELSLCIANVQKPAIAFTGSLCASAAYWAASQADMICCTATAQLGCIGAVVQVVSIARMLADAGIDVSIFQSGKYKTAGSRLKAMTDDDNKLFQDTIAKIGTMFRSRVAAKRQAVSADAMEGQTFMGADAVATGLADKVVSGLDAAVSFAASYKPRIQFSSTASATKPAANPIAEIADDMLGIVALAAFNLNRLAASDASQSFYEDVWKAGKVACAAKARPLLQNSPFPIGATCGQQVAHLRELIATLAPVTGTTEFQIMTKPTQQPESQIPCTREEFDEQLKSEWRASAQIRAEFAGEFKTFASYRRRHGPVQPEGQDAKSPVQSEDALAKAEQDGRATVSDYGRSMRVRLTPRRRPSTIP